MNKGFYLGFIGVLGFLGFNDPWYFLFFLFFLFFITAPKQKHSDILQKTRINSEMPELIKAKEEQKSENRNKVLDMLKTSQRISNNEVEKALGVSDATAERYLDQLEKEGVLKQVGKVGKAVYYEKI